MIENIDKDPCCWCSESMEIVCATLNMHGASVGQSATEAIDVDGVLESCHVIALQEVTATMLQDLQEQHADSFEFVTPMSCGLAQQLENYDIVLAVSKQCFKITKREARSLNSDQDRRFVLATLQCKQSGANIAFGTVHLESGV